MCAKNIYSSHESVNLFIEPDNQKSLLKKIDGTSELFCHKKKIIESDDIAIVSIEEVTKENDIFKKAYNSSFWTEKPLLIDISNEVGIFEYTGNFVAVIFSEVSEKYYYAYIYDKYTDVVIEVMKLEKNENINPNANSPIANSSKINLVAFISTGQHNERFMAGWGACMSDAMPLLFDDWEDDPSGTLTCWLFSPLCVIGAGIGCAIQQLR